MKTALEISANYSYQLKTFTPMKLALLLMASCTLDHQD